jgi:hypothetical protein
MLDVISDARRCGQQTVFSESGWRALCVELPLNQESGWLPLADLKHRRI